MKHQLIGALAIAALTFPAAAGAQVSVKEDRKRIAALAAKCAPASDYRLKGVEAEWRKTQPVNPAFEAEFARIVGPVEAPSAEGADILIRGIIGEGFTQTIRSSTAAALWRDGEGVWRVSWIDHASYLPLAPSSPDPDYFERSAREDGMISFPTEALDRLHRRVAHGRLKPEAAKRLDALVDDPCFELEARGIRSGSRRGPVEPCAADYAGSTLEIGAFGQRRYVSTDCRGKWPSSDLSYQLFYPDPEFPAGAWPTQSCADCYRYVSGRALLSQPERFGDAGIDARVEAAHAKLASGDFAAALPMLEALAAPGSPVSQRWRLLPALAYAKYKTGDARGAAIDAISADVAARVAQGRYDCATFKPGEETRAKFWPEWLPSYEAHVEACAGDLANADAQGLDAETIKLIERKASHISDLAYEALRPKGK